MRVDLQIILKIIHLPNNKTVHICRTNVRRTNLISHSKAIYNKFNISLVTLVIILIIMIIPKNI